MLKVVHGDIRAVIRLNIFNYIAVGVHTVSLVVDIRVTTETVDQKNIN